MKIVDKNLIGKKVEQVVLFSERKKLEEDYYDWISKSNARDCPFNVISYLQAIGRLKDKHDMEADKCSRREWYQKGYQDGLNADKWIPCSERLPSESGEYNVTNKKTDGKRICYQSSSAYFNGKTWHSDFIGICNGRQDIGREVIAWQPLPQGYKKEGAE